MCFMRRDGSNALVAVTESGSVAIDASLPSCPKRRLIYLLCLSNPFCFCFSFVPCHRLVVCQSRCGVSHGSTSQLYSRPCPSFTYITPDPMPLSLTPSPSTTTTTYPRPLDVPTTPSQSHSTHRPAPSRPSSLAMSWSDVLE